MKSHIIIVFAVLAVIAAVAPAGAAAIALTHVTIIDVEDGSRRTDQTLIVDDGVILKIGDADAVKIPAKAETVDGSGKYVIPGLWDMHVHSHREGRWKYHYPLFLAHGVIGIRDAGSHLGSALAAREWTKTNPIAPYVVWGSPIIDGAPQVNSFGLSAEDDASARALVREIKRLRFDFVKVYDRLSPEAYRAIADEARKRKLRLEGHVPLSLSPTEATASGQALIDHLTLVLESCTPGALEFTHEEFARSPAESDSLALLMDERLVSLFDGFDPETCDALFENFAANGVWQVPTLVEMRGYFHADDPEIARDPRLVFTTPDLSKEWQEWSETADKTELASGRKTLAAQMRIIRAMKEAGVGLLAGTDASNEPYVFAGASVHDEMALFVEAGLTPLEALQTATINPLRYLGRTSDRPVIAKGEPADLVILDADPLTDISNTTKMTGVFAHGDYFDRSELGALIDQAKTEAAKGGG
jgi:hypothetical protein